jgi:hypothetical protein
MSDDRYDDGLVHSHSWSCSASFVRRDEAPLANLSEVRTPSTVAHDDHMFQD